MGRNIINSGLQRIILSSSLYYVDERCNDVCNILSLNKHSVSFKSNSSPYYYNNDNTIPMAKGFGRLPDLSSKYVYHLTRALNCLDRHDFIGASTGLHALNSVLPDEYQIKIDTIEYNKRIKTDILYVCNNPDCTMQIKELVDEGTDEEHIETKQVRTENKVGQLEFFDLYAGTFDRVFSGQKSSKVWVCPECENVSKISETQIIKPELQQPSFLRVVPDEPKKFGLERGINYAGQFSRWFANYYHELENSARDVRIEYVGQMQMMEIEGGLPEDKGD